MQLLLQVLESAGKSCYSVNGFSCKLFCLVCRMTGLMELQSHGTKKAWSCEALELEEFDCRNFLFFVRD